MLVAAWLGWTEWPTKGEFWKTPVSVLSWKLIGHTRNPISATEWGISNNGDDVSITMCYQCVMWQTLWGSRGDSFMPQSKPGKLSILIPDIPPRKMILKSRQLGKSVVWTGQPHRRQCFSGESVASVLEWLKQCFSLYAARRSDRNGALQLLSHSSVWILF